ncbi:MAG: TetR/AcrR family transcriptional regulator [Gemmataceae bacterium]|nr:TetR/AcrR family transcriptional regulator [Gemmataceae bacterium]
MAVPQGSEDKKAAEPSPLEERPGPGRPKDPTLEARRKAQILDVAARVFAAHGFANTTVQTIANYLGVGNGTVYRYFPTKDQLFLAAVERGLQELTDEMDRVLQQPGDPLDILHEAVRTYLRFFQRRPEMAELFIQERAAFPQHHRPLYFASRYDDEKFRRHQEFYQRLLATGRIRALPFEQLFHTVGDLLYGTILTNLLSGRPADPEAQTQAIVDLILNGLLQRPDAPSSLPQQAQPVHKVACGQSAGQSALDRNGQAPPQTHSE